MTLKSLRLLTKLEGLSVQNFVVAFIRAYALIPWASQVFVLIFKHKSVAKKQTLNLAQSLVGELTFSSFCLRIDIS